MYINLRKKYPSVILIPTADILFAELSHIFRTKEYYGDLVPELRNPNPLKLDPGVVKLFTASIKGTAQLWENEYRCAYLPPGFDVQEWIYWKENHSRGMRDNSPYPDYVATPSYVAVRGPPPSANIQNLGVKVSLTEEDLVNDVKWLPELELELTQMRKSYCRGWGLMNSDETSVIRRLCTSYLRFLYLVYKYPSEADKLAPPVSIDLCWHAHMTLTKIYYENTVDMLGGVPLEHHPWKDSSKLLPINADSTLACLWKTLWNTDIQEDHKYTDGQYGW